MKVTFPWLQNSPYTPLNSSRIPPVGRAFKEHSANVKSFESVEEARQSVRFHSRQFRTHDVSLLAKGVGLLAKGAGISRGPVSVSLMLLFVRLGHD